MAFTTQEIKNYIESVKYDPVAIAQTAGKYGVSMDDIASAMGYNTGQVVDYLKTGLQNAGMDVHFEGGEQQGEAGSTYLPMTISSFSKPVDGSNRKYEAFSADMQSRGIVDNGSLASQMLPWPFHLQVGNWHLRWVCLRQREQLWSMLGYK